MRRQELERRYPVLTNILSSYFSDESGEAPLGSDLHDAFISGDAPAKALLKAEIQAALRLGDSLMLMHADPSMPVSVAAFSGNSIDEANRFLVEKIWDVFWSGEIPTEEA